MGTMVNMALSFPMQGLLGVIFTLLGIALTWYALGAIRWEMILRHPSDGPSRVLRLIIAIIIGMQLGRFCVDYVNDTMWLRSMHKASIGASAPIGQMSNSGSKEVHN